MNEELTTTVETTTEAQNEINGKNIDDINENLDVSDVPNDVTGNWEFARISKSGVNLSEYAISYYKKYFTNDNEIHFIINYADNTTTKISALFGSLSVTVYEHVDGEEHDANLLPSGNYLAEYFVYTDTGEIEQVY